LQRFLLVSSQAAAGPSPTPAPIDESRPLNPVSWYGRSKADAEALALRAHQDGMPITIVRPVSVYGERETDLSGGSFPAVNAGLAPRIGFREMTITVVYVGDLVEGMVAAAESHETRGKAYFLADRTITSGDLVRAVADALRKRVRIPLIVPTFFLAIGGVLAEWMHFFTRARPGLTRDKVREIRAGHWAATAAAAKRDFGWEAQVALPEGLRRATADWALRRKQAADFTAQPDRERAVQTYLLGVAAGLVCEGTSYVARWYQFHPPWLIVVAVLGYFGAMVGTLAFLLARQSKLIQFLASGALFVAVELANNYVLHLWEFTGPPFAGLNPFVRAGILAIPVGLVPVVNNAIVGAVYRTRLRIG